MASPWLLTGNAGTKTNTNFVGTTDNQPLVIKSGSGKVGIGTETPAASLDVGSGLLHVGGTVNPTVTAQGAYLGWNGLTGGTGETDFINNQGLGTGGFAFMNTPPSGNPRTTLMVIEGNGNVGIGTTSPRSVLEADVAAPSALGPTLTLTNTSGGANAAASVDLNTFTPSASGTYNPSSRIEALDDGNYSNDIVFLTNNPPAPNNGLIERMRITCAPQIGDHPVGFPWPVTESRVGIGTAAPSAQLSISGRGGENVGSAFSTTLRTSSGSLGALGAAGGDLALASFCCSVDNLNGLSLGIRAVRTAASPAGWPSTAIGLGMDVDNTVRAGAALFLHASGNVGVGISTPTSKLHVAGDIAVTGDVFLTGADCAEHFDAIGKLPEPGTVVVIESEGAVRESQQAYDKKVAGVVSGAGEYRHGLVLDKRSTEEGRIPVALMGKVYCKVDAQFSPIEVGDLLTTSPTPGHAMKAADPLKAFGSVIGKALRPLSAGLSTIPILISLQ